MHTVLIISPDTTLDNKSEIINMSSGVIPQILTGTVTRQRALEEIASGKYDIVHFATHGREHALQVSDGVIEEDMLEHAVRKATTVKVLFLNACKSVHSAVEVYTNTSVNYAIGWPASVPDSVAIQWGKLFYEALRIDPDDIKRATMVANDSILKTYSLDPKEMPIVLNGRAELLAKENRKLHEYISSENAKSTRIPNWLITANIAAIIVLLILALILVTIIAF